MPCADLLKRSAGLACVGLVAGLGVGWLLRTPGPPRAAIAAVASPPPVAPAADPIAALVAATAPPARAASPDRIAWTSAPQRVERREPTEIAAAPADINARPAAPAVPQIAGPAATRGSAVAETPQGATAVYTRLEVVEGGAFRALGRLIRLADVEALGPDETCRDARGAEWPCGRRALAALRDLVRQRSVHCVEAGEEGGAQVARCRVGRTDLSAWLVEQGWARPRGPDDRLAGLHQEARSARAGQFGSPAATR